MTAICGIIDIKKVDDVNRMLNKMSHRGNGEMEVFMVGNSTLGIINQYTGEKILKNNHIPVQVGDQDGNSRFAEAVFRNGTIELYRDQLGVAPLYYGYDNNGVICFASEIKALLTICSGICELPPGNRLINGSLKPYFQLSKSNPLNDSPEKIAIELRKRLENAIDRCIENKREFGSWLSGGLDSSIITALARPKVGKLHSFSIGFDGAPDLKYAKEVADYCGTTHHEVVVDFSMLRETLPKVIYHLESFDALLVRSSVTNYIMAKVASDFVPDVFSGECADEFFAGYEYMKNLSLMELDDELIEAAKSLHNTALQRVDRCASAHGIRAHVVFADPGVFEYALSIPARYKLYNGVEKWILRRAMEGLLPESVLNRKKAKFWEGAGTGNILSDYAEKQISDQDFNTQRKLYNGWILNSKEELLYYQIFRHFFGEPENLEWMGRTKGSPKHKNV